MYPCIILHNSRKLLTNLDDFSAECYFQDFDLMPFSDTNAIRVIGLATVTVLLIITLIGLDWEARVSTEA